MKMMTVPGAPGREANIARYIIDQLRKLGIKARSIGHDSAHRLSPFGGEVGNLIVKLPGQGDRKREPRRLLSAHMDTVPLCLGAIPERRGHIIRSRDKNTGLGGDDRSGCAVILTALRTLIEHDLPHPPLTLCWFVQEEVGLVGSRHVSVSRLGRPAFGFNFDGRRPGQLVIGATGAYRMNITVRGIAAHAGVHPERGVSASVITAMAIADLQKNGWHGRISKRRSTGTANLGPVSGGAATNVVTDQMHLRAEARSHDAGFRRRIVGAWQKAFKDAAAKLRNDAGRRGSVEFHIDHDYESFALGPMDPVVEAARHAVSAARLKPEYRIVDGGLDANNLTQHGVPTVTLGCGQRDIHTVRESMDLRQYHAACRIALHLARGQ